MPRSPRVHRVTIDDIADALPVFAAELPSDVQAFDLYVGALGFEPRTTAVATFLEERGTGVGSAVLVEYATNQIENGANRRPMEAALFGCGAKDVTSAGPNLSEVEEVLRSRVAKLDAGERISVLLDISTASNRLVLSLIRILVAELEVDLTISYTEAMTYYPTRSEFELNGDLWGSEELRGLEWGVGDVHMSVDFPGDRFDQLPEALILFAGFGVDRALAAISDVFPTVLPESTSALMWVVGRPHREEDAWRVDALKSLHHIEPDRFQIISTFDYKETVRFLEEMFQARWRKSHLTIVPLGSKFQALGVAMYAIARPEIRLLMPSPSSYRATQYSDGVRDIWWGRVGASDQLATLLRSLDSLAGPQ